MTGDGKSKMENGGAARLLAHGESCEECAAHPLPLGKLAGLLVAHPEPPGVPMMSQRLLAAAAPLLAANAARVYRGRLVAGVVLSLAPFPLLVFFNLYLLREAYVVLASWLPVGMVAWLVVGYAAMLLLLCALTYAALPVLIARTRAQAYATG
jgi:hypothetical protein